MSTLKTTWWSSAGWRGFVRAMRGTDCRTTPLVAADWLDDEGQVAPFADAASARAELMRWQCDGDGSLPPDVTAFRLFTLNGDGPPVWLLFQAREPYTGTTYEAHYHGDGYAEQHEPPPSSGWAFRVQFGGRDDIDVRRRLTQLLDRVAVGHLADAHLLRFRLGRLAAVGYPAWRFNTHTVGPAVAFDAVEAVECQFTYPARWTGGLEWVREGPEKRNAGTLPADFVSSAATYLYPTGLGPLPAGAGEAIRWDVSRRTLQDDMAVYLYRRGGKSLLHPACYFDTRGVVPRPVWDALRATAKRERFPDAPAALVALDRAAAVTAARWAAEAGGEAVPLAVPGPARVEARAAWESTLFDSANAHYYGHDIGPRVCQLMNIDADDFGGLAARHRGYFPGE